MSKTINAKINAAIRRSRGVTVGGSAAESETSRRLNRWIRSEAGREVKAEEKQPAKEEQK